MTDPERPESTVEETRSKRPVRRGRLLPSPELKAQKRRNVAIAAGLVAFMVLIFLITAMRLMQNIAERGAG